MAHSPAKTSLKFLKASASELEQKLKHVGSTGHRGNYHYLLADFPALSEEESAQPHLLREWRLNAIEHLMCMGANNPRLIGITLGLAGNTAEQMMEQCRLRRLMDKKTRRVMRVSRDEARQRLDLMMEKAWGIYHGESKAMLKLQALSTLVTINDRLMILDNLTPKTIPTIQEEEEVGQSASVDARMIEHNKMLALADELLAATEVIDGECVEVDHTCDSDSDVSSP